MKSLLFLCATFFCLPFLAAQPELIDDRKTIAVLVFEHFEKNDLRFIREGGGVKYKLRGDSRKVFVGKIDSIAEKSMVVNGQEIQFANCSMIAGRIRTDKEMTGGLLTGLGFASLGFGAGMFGIASITSTASVTVVAGTALFTTGMVLIFNKKRFNLNKGWTVHGGTLEYNLAD